MAYEYNSTVSGQATGTRTIKRMEFEYAGTSYKFELNPEEYSQNEPSRVTLTQTKGGAWIDAWGAGIIEISIKGTTGVRGGTINVDTGYNRFKKLRELFKKCNEAVTDGEEVTELIKFYNHTDNEFFYCYPKPDGIQLLRSKSRPHMYQYSIGLYAIRRIGEPASSSGSIGNPNKTEKTGGGKSTTKTTSAVYNAGPENPTMFSPYSESQADYTTYTTTRSRYNVNIIDDAKEYSEKMASIIGGRKGKISPATAFQCMRGLDLQSTGTVANVMPVKIRDLIDEQSTSVYYWLYANKMINTQVAIDTYEMTRDMKKYSRDWLSTEYTPIVGLTPTDNIIYAAGNSKEYDSTLYVNSTDCRTKGQIGKADYYRIKILILECMRVYVEVSKIASVIDPYQTLTIPVTPTQAQYIIDNLHAMHLYLQITQDDSNRISRVELMRDLRKLEKLLTQIKTDVLIYL